MARQHGQPGVSMRLALVLVAVLVGGAIAGAIAMAVASGGDDESTADTTTTTPLRGDAADLLARLQRGREGAVHVRLASAAGALSGGTVTVEIWRDGSRVRQDVVLDNPSSHTEVSGFQLSDGNVLCQRAAADAAWQCRRSGSAPNQEGDPVGLIEAVAANLHGAEVSASDDDIGGTAVRCYAIGRADGESSLCLTDDGVPMRLSTQGQELTATGVDHEVSDDVFTPPAAVPDE